MQSEDGGITVTVERNAFLDIPSDVYSKNMLTKLKVPYVVHNNKLVVIGEAAFELANVFGRETRRPMCDGLISPNETDALLSRYILPLLDGELRFDAPFGASDSASLAAWARVQADVVAVAGQVLDPLALRVLQGEFHEGDTVAIDASGDALTFTRREAARAS